MRDGGALGSGVGAALLLGAIMGRVVSWEPHHVYFLANRVFYLAYRWLPSKPHKPQVCFIGEVPAISPTLKMLTTMIALGKRYPATHKSKINNTCAQYSGSSILRILKINLAHYILARHHC